MTDQKTLKALSDLWFAAESKPFWFEQNDDFDQKLKSGFASLLDDPDRVEALADDPQLMLPCILLFDQLPRNLFRGTSSAFAFDARARKISRLLIDQGLDRAMSVDERLFVYMPFQHSEELDDQHRSIRLYEALGDDFYVGFAKQHCEIIERFGRFPYRNKVLGRTSTKDEELYLANEMPEFGAKA